MNYTKLEKNLFEFLYTRIEVESELNYWNKLHISCTNFQVGGSIERYHNEKKYHQKQLKQLSYEI